MSHAEKLFMYKVGKTLNYVDWAPKACIKRCVFNLRLKVSMSEIALICDGRKFHWRLPATAKARSSNCSLVAGINKSVDDDDLSDVRYAGQWGEEFREI